MIRKSTVIITLSVFLSTICSSCQGDNDNAVAGKVYEDGSVLIDTLTINGHLYFLLSGGMSSPQLQHEASCEMRDYERTLDKKEVFVFSKRKMARTGISDSIVKALPLLNKRITKVQK